MLVVRKGQGWGGEGGGVTLDVVTISNKGKGRMLIEDERTENLLLEQMEQFDVVRFVILRKSYEHNQCFDTVKCHKTNQQNMIYDDI